MQTDADVALNYELLDEHLTDMQRRMHGIIPEDSYLGEDPVPVDTLFAYEQTRTGRAPHIRLKMECQIRDGSYCYSVPQGYHYLAFSYMLVTLPALKVTSKNADIQICWPRNIGLLYTTKQTLKSSQGNIQTFDRTWLCMMKQDLLPANWNRDAFDSYIGNIDDLTEWTTFLPKMTLPVPQLWNYCRDESQALQLVRANNTTFTHIYETARSIFDLLRIRRRTSDGSWVEVKMRPDKNTNKTKTKAIARYANMIRGEKTFQDPELWGRFYKIDEHQLTRTVNPKEEYRQYVHDVIECPSGGNCLDLGRSNKDTISLDSKGYPCISIHWAAENITASEVNNHCNHTTNASSILQGWSPIDNYSISYGNLNIEKVDAIHAHLMDPFYNGSPHTERGYHLHSIAHYIGASSTVTTSVLPPTSRLTVELADQDPFIDDDSEDEDIDELDEDDDSMESRSTMSTRRQSCKFEIKVRLLVSREITYRDGMCIPTTVNTTQSAGK